MDINPIEDEFRAQAFSKTCSEWSEHYKKTYTSVKERAKSGERIHVIESFAILVFKQGFVFLE